MANIVQKDKGYTLYKNNCSRMVEKILHDGSKKADPDLHKIFPEKRRGPMNISTPQKVFQKAARYAGGAQNLLSAKPKKK